MTDEIRVLKAKEQPDLGAFSWADPFLIEDQLEEDERMIRDSARAYCDEKLMPRVKEAFAQEKTDPEIFREMGAMGLLGTTIPEEYGGLGAGYVTYGLVAREVERVDSGYRSMMSVQSSLVMYPIYAYGTEAQRKKYLPKLATGEWIGCFGLTEPDAGSDPASMKTNAKQVDGGYILNGAKMWITNSPISDLAVVWAKDEGGVIRGFIVERGMKGFSTPTTHGKWSLRASATGELVFDNVKVPKENILPNVIGLKGPLGCLSSARFGIAWGALGCAMDCYDTALRYSQQRIQFDKPIGAFQLTQKKLAEMITEITKGQLMVWRLGVLRNEHRATPEQISMAKRNSCETAITIAREARQILGGMGITGEFSIMRHMMNLESVITYEGTHDIHLLITGQSVTGFNAFK